MKEDQTLETGLGTDCQFSSTIGFVRIALFLDRTIGNQSVARTNLPLRLQCVPCYFSISVIMKSIEGGLDCAPGLQSWSFPIGLLVYWIVIKCCNSNSSMKHNMYK